MTDPDSARTQPGLPVPRPDDLVPTGDGAPRGLRPSRRSPPEKGGGPTRPGGPEWSAGAGREAPQSFGRYQLLEILGHGGMGIVWKAFDTRLRRTVALKGILAEGPARASQVERFMREARAAARLKHPNIAPVFDVGVHEGQHYFTTDFIAGGSLDRMMQNPVPLRRAAEIVRTVAEALQYAHDQGIVHRDVKPGNIMIDGKGVPHVMDFGLAKDVESLTESGTPGSNLTVSGVLIGTPRYMSPEQAGGGGKDLGPASDQFSLGIVLYQLLTGRLPFEGEHLRDILNAITESEPPRPSQINRHMHKDVETICLRALEKNPARRYPRIGDMAADLGRFLDGEPIEAHAVSPAGRLWRKAVKRRAIVVPVGLALLAAAGFGIQSLLSHRALQGTRLALEGTQKELVGVQEAGVRFEGARLALELAGRMVYEDTVRFAELAENGGKARKAIEEGIARDPKAAMGPYLLGRAHALLGEPESAEAAWRKAIALDPSFGPPHFELGRLLLARVYLSGLGPTALLRERGLAESRRLAEEALAEFEKAQRGAGFDDPLQRALADALNAYARKDLQAAGRRAQEAVKRFEKVPGVEELEWLLAQVVRPEQRMPLYDSAVRRRPHYPLARYGRALLREDAGDLDGALSDLDDAVEFGPRFADAFNHRGIVHARRREFGPAEADFQRALEIRPREASFLANRADLLCARGDAAAGIAAYGEAIQADPEYSYAWFNRANARRDAKDPAGAIEDYTQALRIDPKFVSAWLNRGSARKTSGDLPGAVADFTEALNLKPGNDRALYNRGNAKYALQDVDGALADYSAAIDANGSNADALWMRCQLRQLRGDLAGGVADGEKALQVAPAGWPHRRKVEDRLKAIRAASGTDPQE